MYTQFSKWCRVGATLSMAALMLVSSCKDDDEAGAVTVSMIMSGTTDLNGATPAANVGVSDDIKVTFSKEVDAATATSANFSLTPTGGTAVASTVSANGAVVTVNPTDDLLPGTNYSMTISANVKAKDGGAFVAKTITFKTAGRAPVTPPQSAAQRAYFNFDNAATSSVGTWTVTNTATTFGPDRFGTANGAAVFNGTTSIIEVDNGAALVEGASHSISVWVKVDTSNTHGHFVMGMSLWEGNHFEFDTKAAWFKNAAAFYKTTVGNQDSIILGGDAFFNGEGNTSNQVVFNNNIGGATGVKNLFAGKWAHLVYTFNAATKERNMYVNGVKQYTIDYDQATDANLKKIVASGIKTNLPQHENKYAFGFSQSRNSTFMQGEPWGDYSFPGANHFKGSLDDARFWGAALTDAEVTALYNAEKP